MENITVVAGKIFNEVPRTLVDWWTTSVQVTTQLQSDVIKNITFSPTEWLESGLAYFQTFGNEESAPSTWWVVSLLMLIVMPVLVYLGLWTQKRQSSPASNIPGPITIPILGNVATFAGCNLVQFFHKLIKVMGQYGPIVRFWMGNKLYIVISDADTIENILSNKSLIKKNSSVSKIINGNGVVAPDEDKWKIHRRIISSTFNTNVLEQFMESFTKNSFILCDNLKSVADGSTFDVYAHICSCALDVICETTMSTNVDIQMEGDKEFKSRLLQALDTLGDTFKKPWMISEWIHSRKAQEDGDKQAAMKYLHEFVDRVMAEKAESRRNGFRQKQQVEYVQWVRGRELSLLELLVQDDQLTADEIRDELCTLIVAGTKVVAVTCCFVLSLLGVHQDVQDRVLEEQEKIFGPDDGRPANIKDLNNMKYLEQVMKETLRLYPPVPFVFRSIEEDTHLDNGYVLPRDSCAVIFNYVTHRDPEHFTDPEVFNPNRFSSEGGDRHPYAYIPFGGGRRICVAYKYGMLEAKTILSTVLRQFRVTQSSAVQELEQDLQAGIVLKPASGFSVQMTPRPAKVIPSIFPGQ
ncbi:cytochrome P450 4C1-like [Periplaneta americana]|uniref:cytochrome P450 4C1-like n=1 Tax=Periplaneta americana TaxID=6978 RepID=UPI0037E8F479